MADHRRFFIPPEHIADGVAKIGGDTARQISRVLRLRPGDTICLLDGSGVEHDAEIVSLSKDEIKATIKVSRTCEREPRLRLALAICLPRNDRMDLIVQKGTELGISEYVVVYSERVVAHPTASRFEQKLSRWRRIAAESAEQCGRARSPVLRGPVGIGEVAREAGSYDLALVPWEEERQTTIGSVLREARGVESVLLLIGPEGGLAAGEVEALTAAGARPVSLGKRILRTETAAIAACAIVMHELEGDV